MFDELKTAAGAIHAGFRHGADKIILAEPAAGRCVDLWRIAQRGNC